MDVSIIYLHYYKNGNFPGRFFCILFIKFCFIQQYNNVNTNNV